MLITPVSSAPLPWYDRSLESHIEDYDGQLGPHSLTLRAQYVIPAGKVFRLSTAYICVGRLTAATTVGLVNADIRIKGDEVVLRTMRHRDSSENTLNTFLFDLQIGDLMLNAENEVRIQTSDTSTGGIVRYTVAIIGNLFTI
ncbi:hypothetical protein LCGC14_1128000 [marine sediment metagenome]|uniref:Uncharacterized protein n=1 Tax=marine sediment metagenome TaxID=412755 RepID=A0A0F9M220_9ZZZZ